jgi:hypothetical protein
MWSGCVSPRVDSKRDCAIRFLVFVVDAVVPSQAQRPTSSGAVDQVRACHQRADGKDAWPHRAADAARPE